MAIHIILLKAKIAVLSNNENVHKMLLTPARISLVDNLMYLSYLILSHFFLLNKLKILFQGQILLLNGDVLAYGCVSTEKYILKNKNMFVEK